MSDLDLLDTLLTRMTIAAQAYDRTVSELRDICSSHTPKAIVPGVLPLIREDISTVRDNRTTGPIYRGAEHGQE